MGGVAEKQCVSELREEPENSLKQALYACRSQLCRFATLAAWPQERYNQYGLFQPECDVQGFLEGCVATRQASGQGSSRTQARLCRPLA